jgi:hypothetical protein
MSRGAKIKVARGPQILGIARCGQRGAGVIAQATQATATQLNTV